ncbi:hypothetical protein TH0294_07950 [Helicobacter pylori]
MQDAHGSLKELCANSEKDNHHLTDKLKKLESAQKNLANSNNQLLQAKEKIAEEKNRDGERNGVLEEIRSHRQKRAGFAKQAF